MTEGELHDRVWAEIKALCDRMDARDVEFNDMRGTVAVLDSQHHAPATCPLNPQVAELKSAFDQFKGGMRMVTWLLGIPAVVAASVAAISGIILLMRVGR